MLKTIILMLTVVIMGTGCNITTRPSVDTMTALNQRLSNIEKSVKTRPQAKGAVKNGENLTEAQREFIEMMMDYLGDE